MQLLTAFRTSTSRVFLFSAQTTRCWFSPRNTGGKRLGAELYDKVKVILTVLSWHQNLILRTHNLHKFNLFMSLIVCKYYKAVRTKIPVSGTRP